MKKMKRGFGYVVMVVTIGTVLLVINLLLKKVTYEMCIKFLKIIVVQYNAILFGDS